MPTTNARFRLGQIVVTRGAIASFEVTVDDPRAFLNLHARGDWGDLDDEDRRLNDEAIETGVSSKS